MAKNIYLGVDGKARKMKKAYIGIDGKAHKIKKVYVGVDGKAKLAYTSYTPVTGISLSWSISSPYFEGTIPSGSIKGGNASFSATVSPADATNKKLTWSISGGCSIAGYSDTSCSVRVGSTGSSYLTVTSADGVVAMAKLYVEQKFVTTTVWYEGKTKEVTGKANVITSISRL